MRIPPILLVMVLTTVHDETFPGPGAVGVWSKADSITEFQNFNYEGKS